MSRTGTVSYSTDGPECPNCGFTFTPDEGSYFDDRYTEDECQECGKGFKVEVAHSTSWRCTLVEPALPTSDGAK